MGKERNITFGLSRGLGTVTVMKTKGEKFFKKIAMTVPL